MGLEQVAQGYSSRAFAYRKKLCCNRCCIVVGITGLGGGDGAASNTHNMHLVAHDGGDRGV